MRNDGEERVVIGALRAGEGLVSVSPSFFPGFLIDPDTAFVRELGGSFGFTGTPANSLYAIFVPKGKVKRDEKRKGWIDIAAFKHDSIGNFCFFKLPRSFA